MLADMHVYSDHIDPLRSIDQLRPYAFPYLDLDPSIKNINDFKF
jgi:thymidylate synthase